MPKFTRRQFGLSLAGASAAGLLPAYPVFAAEPPPETKVIRLKKTLAICFAPLYVVETYLLLEGFEDVQYVEAYDDVSSNKMMMNGDLDYEITFSGQIVHDLDNGAPITALGGLHVGCYELFAREPIRTISDLKGKRVGILDFGFAEYIYISIMAAYVGLDPKRDIEWVTSKGTSPLELYAAGDTDAYLAFPPEPQMLRDRGHNRVILNTVQDHPWSQYFCCSMYGDRARVRDHPIATKRFLRAMYNAAKFCSSEPKSAARKLVEGGFAKRYDYALETIEAIPYDLWHDYNVEDTMRFYALRMYDAGMLKNNPNTLLAEGTDWRFLDELRYEMKG